MGFLVLIPIFIVAVFLLVFGVIITAAIKGFIEWASNNSKPRETVHARIATKRQHVSGGSGDSSASTWYYVTFENTATGDRQEFSVNSTVYSAVADGDTGQLTYQGTRFVDFVRERNVTPPPPAPVLPEPEVRCRYCESAFSANQTKCPSCGASAR